MSYILQQSDLNTFNSVKSSHSELYDSNTDVIPLTNRLTDGTPDGTYSLDETFFSPEAQDFLNDLKNRGFFDNLQTQ